MLLCDDVQVAEVFPRDGSNREAPSLPGPLEQPQQSTLLAWVWQYWLFVEGWLEMDLLVESRVSSLYVWPTGGNHISAYRSDFPHTSHTNDDVQVNWVSCVGNFPGR